MIVKSSGEMEELVVHSYKVLYEALLENVETIIELGCNVTKYCALFVTDKS